MTETPTPQTEPPTSPLTLAQVEGLLGDPIPTCPSCDYSLAGLQSTRCPECGWAVKLRLDDVRDLSKITRRTAVFGLLVTTPSIIQGVVFNIRFMPTGIPVWWWVFVLAEVVLAAPCLLTLVAFRKGRVDRPSQTVIARALRFTRLIVWLGALIYIGSLVINMLQMFIF